MGTGEEAFVVSVYCDITINHVPLQLVQLLEDKNDCNILISSGCQCTQSHVGVPGLQF